MWKKMNKKRLSLQTACTTRNICVKRKIGQVALLEISVEKDGEEEIKLADRLHC